MEDVVFFSRMAAGVALTASVSETGTKGWVYGYRGWNGFSGLGSGAGVLLVRISGEASLGGMSAEGRLRRADLGSRW